jgi:small-conductance mechanosensitive channel
MEQAWETLKEWLRDPQVLAVVKAAGILLGGLLLAKLTSRWLRLRRLHPQQSMIISRVGGVVVMAVAVLWALRELGLDLGVLLGAAGILTVAIGFASQTSASNLISGVFLMGERPFQVGDLIQVGQTTGTVLSIDFLSVKLRTFNNIMVRIPNEYMIKTEFSNLTRFPIRRVDMVMGVAYKEDLDRVREVLLAVADAEPLCLDEPKPMFLFIGYGDSALEFQFSVWAATENFWELRTRMWLAIKRAFDAADIEIPFPHRTLYTGAVTDPMPIRLVGDTPATDAGGTASGPERAG